MQKLYHTLCHGHVGSGQSRQPINGDTTKLQFAEGLTPQERRIAQQVNFLAMHLPGNPMTRKLMGQAQFGARVVYGDCVFMTISLNEQHSALVLRLFRARRSDPFLLTAGMRENKTSEWIGEDNPKLEEPEEGVVELPVPSAAIRAQLAAQNPHSVMAAFQIEVRMRLAQLLGVKMCFHCPDCSCQDRFGSNMLPLGGVFGAAVARGGAVEFQYHSSPHFHLEVFLCNVYQHHTVEEIAQKIKAKLLDPVDVIKWYEWVKFEDFPDQSMFERDAERLREEWWGRYLKKEHDRLCVLPRILVDQPGHAETAWNAENVGRLEAEGETFRQQYMQEAQWVYSRVQEHVHRETSDGFQPLASCRAKLQPRKCKHDFPVSLKHREKARVVCPGNAKKLCVSVRGKRNALGRILCHRRGEWTNGTHPAFAIVFRFNTDTKPNYRLPICRGVHDDELCGQRCDEDPQLSQRIARKAMRAGRLATGYFTGYVFKVQPANKQAIAIAAKALAHAAASYDGKTNRQKMHRAVVRTMSDFHFQTVPGQKIGCD